MFIKFITLILALASLSISCRKQSASQSKDKVQLKYSASSEHFIVSAPSEELAKEIVEAAESFRHDLAIKWLGKELPEWRDKVPLLAYVSPSLGAGGVTSFLFDRGSPHSWQMKIQGSRERVLDSVLPHEVLHTVFATHFGRPLPRWADEGACTTVEGPTELAKQDKFIIQFLTTGRGIAFNEMFQMKQYPADILPLYSQGYSLARYFIQQGGEKKFVNYVGEGMQTNNWTATTKKYYGFGSLSDLQVTWVNWVKKGSPDLKQSPQSEEVQPETAEPLTPADPGGAFVFPRIGVPSVQGVEI